MNIGSSDLFSFFNKISLGSSDMFNVFLGIFGNGSFNGNDQG